MKRFDQIAVTAFIAFLLVAIGILIWQNEKNIDLRIKGVEAACMSARLHNVIYPCMHATEAAQVIYTCDDLTPELPQAKIVCHGDLKR